MDGCCGPPLPLNFPRIGRSGATVKNLRYIGELSMVRYYDPTQYCNILLTSTVQSADTLHDIKVVAEGHQSSIIDVKGVMRDEQLNHSLINAGIAQQCGGVIIHLLAPEIYQDSDGKEHRPEAYVELRWRQHGLARSWSERFYIVDDCGRGLNAILRSNILAE
jgi:hypothetical protein